MTTSAPAPAPYLPPNDIGFYALQSLMADRRQIAEYKGSDTPPLCITERLSREVCKDLLNTYKIASFTGRVPLAVVVCGADATVRHLEETAFDFRVALSNTEFRPVGATIEGFNGRFSGDVLLHVTCTLSDEGLA